GRSADDGEEGSGGPGACRGESEAERAAARAEAAEPAGLSGKIARRSAHPQSPPARHPRQSGSGSGRSGCMWKASATPSSIRIVEPTNGRLQSPVRSITQPAATGDTIAASAEPTFISPLAVPE